jgi:hypothetical protein
VARLAIPFDLRGHHGTVRVSCTVNRDPKRWGYHHLDLPFDGVAAAQGFPVLRANVSFAGQGYDAIMGWVQVVRANAKPPDDRDMYVLDLPPMFGNAALPFGWFGVNPSLFDAPSMVQKHGKLRWLAYSFLCAPPGILMKPVVSALLGFSWGYEFRGDGKTHLIAPRALTAKDWNSHLKFLRSRCPGWRFRPGFSREASSAAARPTS